MRMLNFGYYENVVNIEKHIYSDLIFLIIKLVVDIKAFYIHECYKTYFLKLTIYLEKPHTLGA